MATPVEGLTFEGEGMHSLTKAMDCEMFDDVSSAIDYTGWRNINTDNASYCSDCGAVSWNSCICLRSADPESEEEMAPTHKMQSSKPMEGDGLGCASMGCKTSRQNRMPFNLANHGDNDQRVFKERPNDEHKQEMTGHVDLIEEVNTLQANLDNLKQDKQAMKQCLAESCLTFLHNLKSFRKKLNDHLDTMEKKAKSDLNKMYETYDTAIQTDLSMCDTTAEQLQKIADKLENIECQHRHGINTELERQFSEASESVRSLSLSNNTCKFEFAFHPLLKTFTTNIDNIGQFVLPQRDAPKETPFALGIDINIRHPGDAKPCCISGICQMKNGQILLADKNNQNIKCLDTKYKVMGTHELSAIPNSVCCIGNSEAAVALRNNSIQFVTLDNSLKLTREIKLQHECWGLAHLDHKLYVSDMRRRIYVYNSNGVLINTIFKDHLGQKIFTDSRHIAVHAGLHHVYVSDRDKGIVKIDENGQVLAIYSHQDFKTPHGVCVDPSGRIYVSGLLSHNILCYSDNRRNKETKNDKSHGKLLKHHKAGDTEEIVISSDRVTYPGAICFDNIKSSLLVASYPPFGGCDILKGFSVS